MKTNNKNSAGSFLNGFISVFSLFSFFEKKDNKNKITNFHNEENGYLIDKQNLAKDFNNIYSDINNSYNKLSQSY